MRFRNYRKADLILWLIRIGSVQFRGRFAEQLLALCKTYDPFALEKPGAPQRSRRSTATVSANGARRSRLNR
jgi:hypothetical protein